MPKDRVAPSRSEITSCVCAHFLGYGNLSSRLWFMGREEGGAEVSHHDVPLRRSLRLRTGFGPAEDMRLVWEDLFGTSRMGGTWRWASRFALAALHGNENPSEEELRRYLLDGVGKLGGSTFCAELLPLPVQKRHFMSWYGKGPWASYGEYADEVGAMRARTYADAWKRLGGERWVLCYDARAVPLLLAAWDGRWERDARREDGEVRWYRLDGGPTLIPTPFWGQGRFSKERLLALARLVRKELRARDGVRP